MTRHDAGQRIVKGAIMLTIGALLTGCAYLEDRRQDLTDMAHVNATVIGSGIAVNAGPAIVGFYEVDGFTRSGGDRFKLGLGGTQTNKEAGEYYGIVVPLSFSENYDFKENPYKKYAPTWGSIGFEIGVPIGIGARVDFVEALDFLLGIFGIDILDDDRAAKEQNKFQSRAYEAEPDGS